MCLILNRAAVAMLVGIATAAPILPASAQTSRPVRAIPVDPYAGHIAEASRRFGIPAAWIRAVMRAESAGDPQAVSRAGAIGLMQVMPATWADLRVRHRLGIDLYNPRDNILAGTAYLRELHDRYGSVVAMLAAYNAGPGRYEASLAGRPLPAETRAYLTNLLPMVDSTSDLRSTHIAAVDPLVWTRSPIFIAQTVRMPAVAPEAADQQDRNAERLFVTRSSTETAP